MAKKATIDAARPALTALDSVADTADHVVDVVETAVEVGANTVEQGLEVVADVVPETVEKVAEVSAKGGHKLVAYFRNPKHAAVAVVVLSVTAGAGLGYVGYRLLRKQLEAELDAKYAARSDKEIAEAKAFYARVNKVDQYATPLDALKTLGVSDEDIQKATDALRSYQGEPQTVEITDEPVVELDVDAPDETPETTSNIFVDGKPLEEIVDNFDYDAELPQRGQDAPYVITFDEFNQNENDWTQSTFTYYAGDDILAAEDDSMVEADATVGSENLAKFGYGSKDPRTVYVRNEKTEQEYEVALHEGNFAEAVMGVVAHDAVPSRRMRWADSE